MRKELALIMIVCTIGVSSAYGDTQINITQSPGQTVSPFTVSDSSSNVLFQILSDGQAIVNKFIQFSGSGLTALRTYVFPDSSGTVVLHNATQTISNKVLDANSNSLTNIDNNEIKSNAGINVTKFSTGIVNNTEFDSLDGVTSLPSIVRLGSDVSTSSPSLVDATGLSFSVSSGKVYHFKFLVKWDTTNAGRGIGLTLNGPTTTFLTYDVIYPRTTTAGEIHGRNAYNSVTPTGASPDLTNNLGIIEGLIQPSADGTLIVRFQLQGAAGPTVTVKANSVGFLTEIP